MSVGSYVLYGERSIGNENCRTNRSKWSCLYNGALKLGLELELGLYNWRIVHLKTLNGTGLNFSNS